MTRYWQWSRLVPVRHLDAWEERLGSLAGTTFSSSMLPGGKSVRLHLYAPAERPLEEVASRFGGSITRRNLAMDLAPGSAGFLLRLNRRLVISSSRPPPGESPCPHLHVPPGMAFGTGQHATTALCLRRLAEQIRPGTVGTLLDVGTGSGVLALAAHLLGWRAEGFDNDPKAIREARLNADRNQLAGMVRFRVASVETFSPREPFHLVVANLFAALHEQFLPRMAQWVRPGGRMILSGILASQENRVRQAAHAAELQVVRRWRVGKWLCLLTEPTPPPGGPTQKRKKPL